MDIKIELDEKQAEHVAKLLNTFGGWCENSGDRNTMGIARTAARDILDKLANVRAAAGQDQNRAAKVTNVPDVKHPAARSNLDVKVAKWGIGEKTKNGRTRFITHAGIGDLIWVFQLFQSLAKKWGETIEICPVGMGIKRCNDLLTMVPGFEQGEWNDFDSEEITRLADLTKFDDPDELRGRTSVITGNSQLERNMPLDALYPNIPITWYPEITTSSENQSRAMEIVGQLDGKIVGIYPAADGPVKSWGFWNEHDWAKVAVALHEKYRCSFVLIGAAFDKDLQDRMAATFTKRKLPFVSCVGEHYGTAIEVIKGMDLLLGFPSGLTITGGIFKVPTKWWLPTKTHGYASGGNVWNIGNNWLEPGQSHFETRPMRKVDAELPDLLKSPVLLKALESK